MASNIIGTPIIIDIGSAYVKIGYAGETNPRFCFPCITGTEKYKAVMYDVEARNIYVGDDAEKLRGVLKVNYPIQRGVIMDWNDYYEILNHIFYSLLRLNNVSGHPVLYIESPYVPAETKEYIARVLYETHGAQYLIMIPSPILSCFSVGLSTGLVVESGDGTTWVTPIIDGQMNYQAIQRVNLAGMDISNSLKSLMMREGINIASSAVEEIIREIKERNCYYVIDPTDRPPHSHDQYSYSLPDGSTVNIPTHILHEAPEILFNPSSFGSSSPSIPQAVINCLQSVDKSYWEDLISQLVLSGGNFSHPGLEERFKYELNHHLPQLGKIPIVSNKKATKSKKNEKEIKGETKKLKDMEITPKTKDTCPECGELVELEPGKDLCPNCGAKMKLTQLKINLTKKGSEKKKSTLLCSNCGKAIEDESSIFCPFCGSNLEHLDEGESGRTKLSDTSSSQNGTKTSDDPIKLLKFFIPSNLQFATFSGAAILASLPSFQQLFISHEEFLSDPNLIYRDISQIF